MKKRTFRLVSRSVVCPVTVLATIMAPWGDGAEATTGSTTVHISVSNDVVKISGKTDRPAGTSLVIHVHGDGPEIDWTTTVGAHGVIATQNDLSWLSGGPQLVSATIVQVGPNPQWNDKPIWWFTTNAVSTVIHHRDIGFDVRRYYKPGSPTYAVADFVYVDHWNTTVGAIYWYDVLPGPVGIFVNGVPDSERWFVTDGADLYQLKYLSSSTAEVQAKLLVRNGWTNDLVQYQYQSGPTYLVYCTFTLVKVEGAWWINNINDISKTLVSTMING